MGKNNRLQWKLLGKTLTLLQIFYLFEYAITVRLLKLLLNTRSCCRAAVEVQGVEASFGNQMENTSNLNVLHIKKFP